MAPGIRGGADLAEDHQVDNRRVLDALVGACRAGGVTVIEEEVEAVEIAGGGVAGAVTGVVVRNVGFRAAGTVVLAAGCRSGLLGGIPDRLLPPVRPVKGLTLRLQAPNGVPGLARTVRGLIHGRNCYLVPRVDGSVVVGATVEEKGFDLAVQAGAVGDLLDDARRLVPVLEEYELVDTTTGLRPGSPDNAPMVGATEVRGLVVATGHYRNGFLLAPLTAGEVVGVIAGRTSAPCGATGPFAPFGPDRFAPGARPTGGGTRRGTGPVGDQRVSAALVNGAPWDVAPGATVAELVSAWCASPHGIAVARNGDVVPRSRWERTPVMAGDRIEIVTAAAGG